MAQRRLIPFPFPLHLGTDICRISTVYKLLSHSADRSKRFVRRILSEEEYHAANRRACFKTILNEHLPGHRHAALWARKKRGQLEAAHFMAGRFAAKEAVIKAHPHRRLTFHDITIRSGADERKSIARERLAIRQVERQLRERGGLPPGEDPSAYDKSSFYDVDRNNGSGPPTAIIKGEGEDGCDQVALISISHHEDYATATCLGFVHQPESEVVREGFL